MHVRARARVGDARRRVYRYLSSFVTRNIGIHVRLAPLRHTPPAHAQAKELVESAPCTVMAKVKREDAAKIVEKLKAETGGEFELI